MKILYVAGAVEAPGSHGGATHVLEVAGELSKLGHELHVICRRQPHEPARLTLPVEGGLSIEFYRLRLPQHLNIFSYPWLARLARALQPQLVMERYYNMAGAGMLYAHRHKLPAILEVNALMVDPPGMRKHLVDRLLLGRMRWWAATQCRWAGRIVTPLRTTVPPEIDRSRIVELPWGANVDRFDPRRVAAHELKALRAGLGLPPLETGARVAVFAGSFRHWHGVETLVAAARRLVAEDDGLYFLLLGGGPGEEAVRTAVQEAGLASRIILTGAIPHEQIPRHLALADCGVAPFDTSRHLPLRAAGFFWSPLKIFEYMAMSLPVVTSNLPPLNDIIRSGLEGSLFREGDADDLAAALRQILAPGPEAARRRVEMGASARQRVVQNFSWAQHCRSLDLLIEAVGGRPSSLLARPVR